MRTVLFAACLLVSGCASGPRQAPLSAPRALLDEEFTLALGDSIALEGTPYSIAFRDVIEDSRCAQGTICIWEGNARIELEFRESAGRKFTWHLDTSSRIPTEKYDTGFAMELRRLDPQPREGVKTGGYNATLVARKK